MSRNTSTGSIIGAGTQLGTAAASATSGFTAIAEMRDVKSPHQTADQYEATAYDSPSLGKEYLFGWKDGGEVDVQLNYLTASQALLQGYIGVIRAWQITLPDTHTFTFNGAIKDLTGDNPNKGVCDIKFKIKLTSLPVYA